MKQKMCAPAQHFFFSFSSASSSFRKPNFAPFRLYVELIFLFSSLFISVCSTSVSLTIFTPVSHFFSFTYSSSLSSSCHFLEQKHVSAATARSGSFRILLVFFSSSLSRKSWTYVSKTLSVCVCVLINWFRFGSSDLVVSLGLLVCALVYPDWWVLGTECGLWAIIKAA